MTLPLSPDVLAGVYYRYFSRRADAAPSLPTVAVSPPASVPPLSGSASASSSPTVSFGSSPSSRSHWRLLPFLAKRDQPSLDSPPPFEPMAKSRLSSFSTLSFQLPSFPYGGTRPVVERVTDKNSFDAPLGSAADVRSAYPYPSPEDGEGEGEGEEGGVEYRMYKRRWVGVIAIMILNIVAGMSLVWFGPIADDTVDEFGWTLDQVNWLGNCVNVVYLPCAAVVPWLYSKLGLRRTCYIGALIFLASAWIRYAGTADGLSSGGSYALVIVGQILSGVVQPIFQVLIPGYSEKWFDLRQRTTATMLMSIANPIGVAVGQLISPLIGTPRAGLLVLAIIYSASLPCVFFVSDAPPTPPTRAATQRNPSFASLARAMLGREPVDQPTYMTVRQRMDFAILTLVFGVLVAAVSAFSILSAQDLEPFGYSDDLAGLMGATLLLVGIVTTAVTAPLFDRVFTHHLALTIKVLCPILGGAWLALVWAVHEGDTGGLFALMAVIGGTSLTMLPVAIELAVEATRNADASSALLWASSNLFGVIFVLAEGALRAGPDADPPNNMRSALIFQGAFVLGTVSLVYLIEGRQTRRAADEQAHARLRQHEIAETPRPPRSPASMKSLSSLKEAGEKDVGDLDDPRTPVTVRAVSVDGSEGSDTTVEMAPRT